MPAVTSWASVALSFLVVFFQSLHLILQETAKKFLAPAVRDGFTCLHHLTRFLVFALAITLIFGQSSTAQPPTSVYDRHVVVIAVDGLRADIFQRYALDGYGNPPPDSFFRELSQPAGKYRKHVEIQSTRAVFPSITQVAWASVFTGVYPGKHGIAGSMFYARDLDQRVNFGAHPADGEIFGCSMPPSIKQYGWDLDCAAFWTYFILNLTGSGGFGHTFLLRDLIEEMPDPSPWVFLPIPMKLDVIDTKASGGFQNEIIHARTLYDYAIENDLRPYVVHNFYARSNINAAGQHVEWDKVYGDDLDRIDKYWARPTYDEIRNSVVLPDPYDDRILDNTVVSKAIDHIQKVELPHITTLYFAGIDSTSHHYKKFGYSSLEAAQFGALRTIDGLMAGFDKFLQTRPEYSNTIYLLIADHGHTAVGAGTGITLPEDHAYLATDGFIAQVYLKNNRTGKWTDLPDQSDYDTFLGTDLTGAQIAQSNIQAIAVRDRSDGQYHPYRWDGSSWKTITFDDIEISPYDFVDPAPRVRGLSDPQRSGDVILLPGLAQPASSGAIAFEATPATLGTATHGSLRSSDTSVPFFIFGPAVSQAVPGSKPQVLCGASQVDVTPTILSMFGIFDRYRLELDGQPVVGRNLEVNAAQFPPCNGSGASDFLVGQWQSEQMTRLMLENPTSVERDAAVLYYDDYEHFLGCQIARLSPHGFIAMDLPPFTETSHLPGMFQHPRQGPVEIRAAPMRPEKRPGGLVGYVQYFMFDIKHLTNELVQLYEGDVKQFDVQHSERNAVANCLCGELKLRNSPLISAFCP